MNKRRRNPKNFTSDTSSRRPGQNSKPSIGGTETSSQGDDPNSREMPLSAHIDPVPTGSNESKGKWYRSLQGWKVVLELIAIPFAIMYAIVTYFQWRDLGHNFEVDERAWLKVTYTLGAIEEPLPVNVEIQNIGKSIALQVLSDTVADVIPKGQSPFNTSKPTIVADKRHIPLMFPSDIHKVGIRIGVAAHGSNSPRGLTDSEIESLRRGDAYFVVYGVVLYWDQFGPHWTRFCNYKVYASGTYMADPCVSYNSVGDGDTATLLPKH